MNKRIKKKKESFKTVIRDYTVFMEALTEKEFEVAFPKGYIANPKSWHDIKIDERLMSDDLFKTRRRFYYLARRIMG